MNIVVLTIGRTGSTILTQMLGKLGWNVPLDDYAEPAIIREINDRIIRGHLPDHDECYSAVKGMPSPWVLKDPRFCWTLNYWKDFFKGDCLIWLTRDLAMVELSLRKQDWGQSTPGGYRLRGETLPTLEMWCKTYFKEWEGPKLQLSYENLKAAVSLFDLSR